MEQYEREKRISDVASNSQKNINSRLDGCYIRYLDAATFEEDAGKHDDKQISIVRRGDEIEIWKGDIRIFLKPTVSDKFVILIVNSINPT